MKSLTAATLAEMGATVKTPLILMRVDFGVPLRLTSWGGGIAWDGHDWVGADLRVSGLDVGPGGEQGGQVEVGNTDRAWSALVLAEGIADRPITIWHAYAGATASGDPLEVFAGTGDEAEIRGDRVRISLSSAASGRIRSPRETGGDFSIVMPAGAVVNFNGERFELVRE